MPKLSYFTASIKFSKQNFYNREKCRLLVLCGGFKWPIFHGKPFSDGSGWQMSSVGAEYELGPDLMNIGLF